MKKIKWIIPLFLIIVFLLYISGYRLTSESASKAHAFLKKNALLIKVVNTKQGKVYVYKQNNYYMTIFPIRYGFLWRAPFDESTESIEDKDDKVRTIGIMGYQGVKDALSVMVIEVNDKDVAFIEAGPKEERVRESVTANRYNIFVWYKNMFYFDEEPIALSRDGTTLYKYTSLVTSNYSDTRQQRWHKVDKSN